MPDFQLDSHVLWPPVQCVVESGASLAILSLLGGITSSVQTRSKLHPAMHQDGAKYNLDNPLHPVSVFISVP